MKRAFTLVETIVVVALAALVLFALIQLFRIVFETHGYETAVQEVQNSGEASVRAVAAAVTPARLILTARSFAGTVYITSASVLILELPAVDDQGALIDGVSDYVIFYADGSKLYRIIEAGAGSVRVSGTQTLSSSLSSLSFTYANADVALSPTVTVDLQTASSYKQKAISTHFTEKIYLRNFSPL